MITPSNRLLFWFGMLLPFAAIGAMVPSAAGLALFMFAGLLLVVLIDAAGAYASKHGISVSIPDVIRLSKDNPGIIPLRIKNERNKDLNLRVGLPFPDDIRPDRDELDIFVPAGNTESAVPWSCVPDKRGNFAINSCYFETSSPLGFWNARGKSPCQSVIRVYPNLMGERKRLAAIFLNRGNFGMHTHRMIGQGRDFEKLREYMPGDSFDDIHWKATAKRGKPVTKLFQIERTQEIYVLIDSSRLSARAAGTEPALEHFMTSALTMGLVAEKQSDLFGTVVFSNRIRRFIRASGGKAHYNACRDAIYTLNSEMVSPDFGELSTFIRLRLRRRALLMILTDLGDPMIAESFLKDISLVCNQHLILVTMIKPAGLGPLFSSPDAGSVDSLYRKLGGHLIWKNLRELDKSLRHRNIGFSMIDESNLSTGLVSQYMNVKARQIL